MLRLLITSGVARGAEISVQDEFEIGRHATGEGQLSGDPELSRRHARLALGSDGRYMIEDLGSLNGTQVNGQRIEQPHALMRGDTVEVGSTTLLVAEAPEGTRSATVERKQPGPGDAPRPDGDSPPSPGAPVAASDEPAAAGPVSLRIEIDYDAAVARVWLDEDSQPLELEHREGSWRLRGV